MPTWRALLAFQRVAAWVRPQWPDSAYPQQMHLDIGVSDAERAEQRKGLLTVGATRFPGERETGFRDFTDPPGHLLRRLWPPLQGLNRRFASARRPGKPPDLLTATAPWRVIICDRELPHHMHAIEQAVTDGKWSPVMVGAHPRRYGSERLPGAAPPVSRRAG